MAEPEQAELTSLTVQLLSAYFSNNSVPSNELAALIATTRDALAGKAEAELPAAEEFTPAVSARKSTASRDHIVSMIDGKPYKTLKRHLSGHGLTPDQYRERYKLPSSYPMVAPGYSEHRREVAQRLGLGRKSAALPADDETAERSPPKEALADAAPEAEQADEAVTPPPTRKPRKTATGRAADASAGTEPAQPDAPSVPVEAEPAAAAGVTESIPRSADAQAGDEPDQAVPPKARHSRTPREGQIAKGETTEKPTAKRGRPKGSGAAKRASRAEPTAETPGETKVRRPRARRSGATVAANEPVPEATE